MAEIESEFVRQAAKSHILDRTALDQILWILHECLIPWMSYEMQYGMQVRSPPSKCELYLPALISQFLLRMNALKAENTLHQVAEVSKKNELAYKE